MLTSKKCNTKLFLIIFVINYSYYFSFIYLLKKYLSFFLSNFFFEVKISVKFRRLLALKEYNWYYNVIDIIL